MWGHHRGVYVRSSQDLQNCCGRVGLCRKTTLLHTGQGPYWLEVDYALGDAVARALWVDLNWPWEPSDSWLF